MKKVCFISGSSPNFLGGISQYQRNLIEHSKKNKLSLNFTWLYPGKENKKYVLEGIDCVELKASSKPILKEFSFSKKAKFYLEKNNFDIINSHANWGYFLKKYNKKKGQKIVHTFHGVTKPYMKVQFQKFKNLKIFFYPLLHAFYLLEKPPIKKADKIIGVSEKVKSQLKKQYGQKKEISIIRTGVDLGKSKKFPKQKSRNDLNLEKNKTYGLYSGREGYWNKGLDRAVSISKELYGLNKEYRLIVIGSNKEKCKKYLGEPFVVYRGIVKRKEISKYYSSADFFFFLSRYEGGAPALAVSEAVSSGCLTIQSRDSNQEIFVNGKDCLIINGFEKKEATKILNLLKNKKESNKINKFAKEKIKELSLEKWGKKYFDVLVK